MFSGGNIVEGFSKVDIVDATVMSIPVFKIASATSTGLKTLTCATSQLIIKAGSSAAMDLTWSGGATIVGKNKTLIPFLADFAGNLAGGQMDFMIADAEELMLSRAGAEALKYIDEVGTELLEKGVVKVTQKSGKAPIAEVTLPKKDMARHTKTDPEFRIQVLAK